MRQIDCSDIICRWKNTIKELKTMLIIVIICFLILAIIEVYEVLAYG
ncbi:MAG: hypothetical protein GXO10_03280 [Crenarchaeota archaeon]|nr:hypothetical protein [Thermoproteota archaeon]